MEKEDDPSNTQKMTSVEIIKSHMVLKHGNNNFKITESVIEEWVFIE